MLESIIYVVGGVLLGKFRNVFDKKQQEILPQSYFQQETPSEKPQEYIENTIETPSKTQEIWQLDSFFAKLANFIVFTTRSIITYLFFWLVVLIIGYIIVKGEGVTEYEKEIFNIILKNILPSVCGYWFGRMIIIESGLSTVAKTIKSYIKK